MAEIKNFGKVVGHGLLVSGLAMILSSPVSRHWNDMFGFDKENPIIGTVNSEEGSFNQDGDSLLQENNLDDPPVDYKTIEDLIEDFDEPINALLIVNPTFSCELEALGVRRDEFGERDGEVVKVDDVLMVDLFYRFGVRDKNRELGQVVYAHGDCDKLQNVLGNFRGIVLDGDISRETLNIIKANLKLPLNVNGNSYPRFMALRGDTLNKIEWKEFGVNADFDKGSYYLVYPNFDIVLVSGSDNDQFWKIGFPKLEGLLGKFNDDEFSRTDHSIYVGDSTIKKIGDRKTRIYHDNKDKENLEQYVKELNRVCGVVKGATGVFPDLPKTFAYSRDAEVGVNYDPIRMGNENLRERTELYLTKVLYGSFGVGPEDNQDIAMPLWTRLMFFVNVEEEYGKPITPEFDVDSLDVNEETVIKDVTSYLKGAKELRNRLQGLYTKNGNEGNLLHALLRESEKDEWEARIEKAYGESNQGKNTALMNSVVADMLTSVIYGQENPRERTLMKNRLAGYGIKY